VRHNEGTRIHTLREHKSAVSVLYLAPDERSVLSGSWDKNIHDWDLNLGKIKRSFTGSGGQVSAIEPRPLSKLPVPEESGLSNLTNGTFSSNNAAKPTTNGVLTNGASNDDLFGDDPPIENGLQDAPAEQDDDMNSLFGDDDAEGGGMEPPIQLGDDEDDEFSRAIASGLQQPDEEEASGDVDMADPSGLVQPPETDATETTAADQATTEPPRTLVNGAVIEETAQTNGLPHFEDTEPKTNGVSSDSDKGPYSETTFLDACQDGTIRVWDRRQPNPIARITPPRGTPPWCMSACWSPDGNFIYAGRRNNAVEEYSLHKGLRDPNRAFKFPAGSGPVSAVRTMPNGKHLIWYPFPLNLSKRALTNIYMAAHHTISSASTISKPNPHPATLQSHSLSFPATGQVLSHNCILTPLQHSLSPRLVIADGKVQELRYYWATKLAV
jgi:transcriptional activator SPT8